MHEHSFLTCASVNAFSFSVTFYIYLSATFLSTRYIFEVINIIMDVAYLIFTVTYFFSIDIWSMSLISNI
jgi:hypothetical protein